MSSTVPERTAASAPSPPTTPATRATPATQSATSFPWLPPSWVLVVALVAVAANLRPALAGVPPLVPQIQAELQLSNAWLGVLTLLPVLCMGIFAPVAHRASMIWGSAPVVMVATTLLTVGSLMRLGGSNPVVLYAATLIVGIGIAVVGTLLPRLVKTLFPPERVGLITGVYMLAIMLGATIGAGLSEPLATALGSWEESLAAWSGLGVLGLVAWAPLALVVWRHRREVTAQSVGTALPWRSATAWLIAAYLATQSLAFYSTLAWMAPSYVRLGWEADDAGYLLSAFTAVQIVAGLLMPVLSDRVRDLRLLLVPATVAAGIGLVGIGVAPTAAPWFWAALIGFGQGSAFALALVLLVRFAATPHASGGLSAMGFLVGYGIASVGPLLMGALRDATGGFQVVWIVLAALMLPQLLICLVLRPSLAKVGATAGAP
jgi:MFS transporter, CP family, cyanate transporter